MEYKTEVVIIYEESQSVSQTAGPAKETRRKIEMKDKEARNITQSTNRKRTNHIGIYVEYAHNMFESIIIIALEWN